MYVKCKKSFAADRAEYGVDFKRGKIYEAMQQSPSEFYVKSSENGTEVYMTVAEMNEYFIAV